MKFNLTNFDNTVTVLVDDEDWERLSKFKWNVDRRGYIWACRNQTHYYMHRLVMRSKSTDYYTDHINRDKADNRKCNLRICSQSQNCYNTVRDRAGFSSKFRGVHWAKDRALWLSKLVVKQKRIKLAQFKDEIEAALFYDKCALEYWGPTAIVNFPDEKSLFLACCHKVKNVLRNQSNG